MLYNMFVNILIMFIYTRMHIYLLKLCEDNQKHEPRTISSRLFMWRHSKLTEDRYICDITKQFSLNRHRAVNVTDRVGSIDNASDFYPRSIPDEVNF
jgi:hypothetical protein